VLVIRPDRRRSNLNMKGIGLNHCVRAGPYLPPDFRGGSKRQRGGSQCTSDRGRGGEQWEQAALEYVVEIRLAIPRSRLAAVALVEFWVPAAAGVVDEV